MRSARARAEGAGAGNSIEPDSSSYRTAFHANIKQYLALGGYGFLLGDGRLTYGRENIVETYYTMHVWRGFYPSFGFQYVDHPGYNRDRGPVVVPTLRLHLEF